MGAKAEMKSRIITCISQDTSTLEYRNKGKHLRWSTKSSIHKGLEQNKNILSTIKKYYSKKQEPVIKQR